MLFQFTSSLSLRDLGIAAISVAITTFANWLVNRRKSSAETKQITAQSIKEEAEAREISTRTIMEAQGRIVDLVEINSTLQQELIEKGMAIVEAGRRADNFEYELKRTQKAAQSLEDQIAVYELQLEKARVETKIEQLNEVTNGAPKPSGLAGCTCARITHLGVATQID